ncbi:hypothetical protein LWI28_025805 [Acer negundo]|uniref:WRKY domain-containing protein n=1 Tax=Acer negundo TaxID=4023 RepID=A0AAD5JLW4_ACENE|nr:hypothetical protein LWI28_025805 [Acer negundo]KAK4854816.1 hypothetical protein QYF36_001627 [Acer negundo]
MSTDVSTTSMDQSEEGLNREDEQEMERRRLKLPEDGYEWKKYGQKFIKNIGKFRSYFKCQRENCMAKKRAEWSSRSDGELGEIRIVYDGVHSHDQHSSSASNSQETSASSSNANQYNLLTQVLGGDHQSTSTPRPPHA